ncbi:MAG TPA: hypothetical protein VM123_02640 [archaeon]|nr:hypothetical protein [archaeon]
MHKSHRHCIRILGLICPFFLLASLSRAQLGGDSPRLQFLMQLNAQIDGQIGKFRSDQYIEQNPLQPVEPRWLNLGFIPFARASGRSIYPNTVPGQEERGAALKAFAAPGEDRSLVFGVRALERGVSGLVIQVGGLVSLDTVGVIPPESIELGVVEYFRVRWGEGSAAKGWRWHPTRIWPLGRYPGSPFCRPELESRLWVAPNTAQAFWLTLHTPSDVPAGSYAGSVFVGSDRGSYRIPVFFTVLPLELENTGLPPHGVFVSGPQDQIAVHDLAVHGINALGQWYNHQEMPARYGRGGVVFDFALQDAFMSRLSGAGITGPQIIFAGSPVNPTFDLALADTTGLEIDSPEFLMAYAQAVQSIFEHARKNYRNRLVWGIFDQQDKNRKSLERFRARAQELTKVMGSSAGLISPVTREVRREEKEYIAPYLGIWLLSEGVEKQVEPEGVRIWGYAACTQRDSAAGSRYKTGFGPWIRGDDGVFIWAYNWSGGGQAWNDFDAPSMDWMLSYRDIDDCYVPTPAWEGLREGIDDRRYILTLEKLIAAFPAGYPPAEDARKALGALPSMLASSAGYLKMINLPQEAPPSMDDSPMGLARRLIAGHLIRLWRIIENPGG